MEENSSFAVAWGEIARTLIYTDEDGRLLFTFDFPDNPDPDGIRLEFDSTERDSIRYCVAYERVQEFLIAQGRNLYD